jgi:imidazolonepropionase-like amidohydrolase
VTKPAKGAGPHNGLIVRTSMVLLLVASVGAQGQVPGPPATFIRGATIFTITKGTIPNGSMLLRNGRIEAVGTNLQPPRDAEVVDATGKFVTPGIIDAHVHIAADSINEGATTVSSMTGIQDVFNPTDINIYRDLAGGVTSANVLHGSANPIGGTNAVIKLRWGKTTLNDFLLAGAPPGIKFALGENPKDLRQGFRTGPLRYPVTRMGVEYVIRDAFTRAKAYQHAWQDYEQRKKKGEDVLEPRRDLQLEPLVEVLEGKRLVHAHSYRADEILMLIRIADEMGFKIATFQHVLEGYKVAKEIAAHGAGGSTFIDMWGGKVEMNDAIPYNPALMAANGVSVSLNSDSAERSRRLNTDAAKAMHWGGVTEDQALAMITINPAKQLRIDSRVGSLEPGKDADVVIWSHHPLSTYAIAERVYIDGVVSYDRKADDERLARVQKEKEALIAAEGGRKTTTNDASASSGASGAVINGSGNGGNGSGGNDTVGGPSANGGNTGNSGTTGGQGSAAQTFTSPGPRLASGVTVITNARIHPVTAPTIERGSVLIRDGVIQGVGANVTTPAGAAVIDAAGADVYPGWINARTTLGLADPGARGYADTNEMLEFNPQLRPTVAFHNDSEAIPVTRANGITTAAVTPGGGILGGQVAVMNLDGWTWEESAVRPSAGIAFQFPTLTRGGGGGDEEGPSSTESNRSYDDLKKARDAKLDELERLLLQARAYAKKGAAGRDTDWVLDALVPIVEGRLPLFTRVDAEADIRDAVAFADRVGVKIVISGGQEAAHVAPLLASKHIPVIYGPVQALPRREDVSHAAPLQAPGLLVRAGVKIAFATGDANNARLLPYHAAQAVAWGLSPDDAIKALTVNAAEILGVADRLGSIEVGKQANLVIVTGDPLEIRTDVTHVIIAGRDVDLENKHHALYVRYKARR